MNPSLRPGPEAVPPGPSKRPPGATRPRRESQILTSVWETTNLLGFHGTHGRHLTPAVPPEPPAELAWHATYTIERLLGAGAQGVVYLADRHGADGYSSKVAVKIFYRHPAMTPEDYVVEMRRIAGQAQRVSGIQHDNLVTVRDFVAIGETRVMVLEWIDGIDLAQLLSLRLLRALERKLDRLSWERLNDVVLTYGEDHCRLRPGIAVDILHGCLAGLAALHKKDIVHCDLKPSNIMIKRTGTKKIIDIDSSCVLSESEHLLRGTPYYMAPEQLLRRPVERASDVASLGYILIEMLTGRLLFRDCESIGELTRAKLELPERLTSILPAEVQDDSLLLGLVHKMVAVDPSERFQDADDADLDHVGAVSFHRQLVRDDLATEYDRELANLIESMEGGELGASPGPVEELDTRTPPVVTETPGAA